MDTKGEEQLKDTCKAGGIRVSREISKRYWVSLPGFKVQLQKEA